MPRMIDFNEELMVEVKTPHTAIISPKDGRSFSVSSVDLRAAMKAAFNSDAEYEIQPIKDSPDLRLLRHFDLENRQQTASANRLLRYLSYRVIPLVDVAVVEGAPWFTIGAWGRWHRIVVEVQPSYILVRFQSKELQALSHQLQLQYQLMHSYTVTDLLEAMRRAQRVGQ